MDVPEVAAPSLEAFVTAQGEILQMITQGAPLEAVLERIIRWVEGHSGNSLLASILLADPERQSLRHGAAPSLPDAYNAAIDGVAIGPKVGSCGTAAYTRQTVIVEDIAEDPLWKDFRSLALSHGLRACWSTPLIGIDKELKGTFAIYYRQPRKPTRDDLSLITLVSQLVLMAIEFQHAEEERARRKELERLSYQRVLESERNFRNLVMKAPVGICIVRGPLLIVETVNDTFLELVGKPRPHFENRPYWSTMPDAEVVFGPVLNQVMETGIPYVGREAEVTLVRNGITENVYVDFVYDPITEDDGSVKRVIILGIEVTNQVRARKEIERSEQQVRSLVESAPFPIGVYVGKEKRIQLANQAIIDVWAKGQDVIGKRYTEILPELENQQIFQQLDNVLATGQSFHAKNQRVDLMVNGHLETFYFNYSFTPVFDSQGQVYAVMNTAADVTDLNVSKQRIEESERNLRNIIIQAPVAMCILRGPDHVVEIANERMFELWGRSGQELLGKPVFEGLPEAAGQGFESLLRQVYDTGETFTAFGVPIQLPRKEGIQTRYINFVYEAFREGSGRITGVMAVATDVTEQILATRKIEEAEERARLAIEAAELGTFEVNMDTDATLISERMAAIFDVPVDAKREEFIAAIFPEDLPIRNSAYKNAQENGVLDYDGRVQWKDGTIHWMRVRGKVIRNEEGKPNRLVGVVQDITEQKTFAEALAQQVRERTLELEVKNRELERSNTNLEEFAHVASHDLKEPIRKILFFTDRLKNELAGKITESEERLFGRIEVAGVRMRVLVDDLLQYSHVSQRPPEKELVDLAGKVKKVLEDLELEIEQKQAKITVGPLPQVLGYRRQLQQLFQNLITNALKYHKPGEAPQLSISSRVLKGFETPLPLNELEKEASFCMIEVADAGIGFEQVQAEKAFQMFQRLHDGKLYSGTGVGLSIAKKVAENHGGSIHVTSIPGEGSTFHVFLPLGHTNERL